MTDLDAQERKWLADKHGIVFEMGDHFAVRVKYGFDCYRNGATHATRCAIIGYTGADGMRRAIAECIRREWKK